MLVEADYPLRGLLRPFLGPMDLIKLAKSCYYGSGAQTPPLIIKVVSFKMKIYNLY